MDTKDHMLCENGVDFGVERPPVKTNSRGSGEQQRSLGIGLVEILGDFKGIPDGFARRLILDNG